MKSYVTSFNGLFGRAGLDAPVVKRIEIPIIQRDYAQGREGNVVGRIRASFLDVLHRAVTSEGETVSLDFIYGDVTGGTLRPLDGQQRLTTLFLLHWYLAWRASRLEQDLGWKCFEYAIRPGARRFCGCLTTSNPPVEAKLRAWFEDQHWFLHTWRHDPTIQSMLVMLDAIHERFADVDWVAAWERLVDNDSPSISFHLLPIEQMGLSEDLYIKMNSRGKPLTPFENFKARFEQVLEQSAPGRVDDFAQKVDGKWADLLWPFRGSDNIVDDEFLRYFGFVTEVCEWSKGRLPSGDIDALAERVYGSGNEQAVEHLDFLESCFDTWEGVDIPSVFSELFTLTPSPLGSSQIDKVVLFGAAGNAANLFAECCQGQMRLGWPRTLLLYAVLLHRLRGTAEFPRRLRMLRNLIEASDNELRADKMPGLLSDVHRLIIDGTLDGIASFNQAQVSDEKLKADLLKTAPELELHVFELEDHPLLRGCLAAFELDPVMFEQRARSFHELFANKNVLPVLTGALLAAGDYSLRSKLRFTQLGSGSELSQWREEILTGSSRARLAGVRGAFGHLLDDLANRKGDIMSALELFQKAWLEDQDERGGLDWRWYFVRYQEMRAGRSGIYAWATGAPGYSVCMLDKQAMSSYYRDPFLSAVRWQSQVPEGTVQGTVGEDWAGGPWFTGYETEARWMRLKASGLEVQCTVAGFLIRAPSLPEPSAEAFARVCKDHGIGPDLLLGIPKVTVNGAELDEQDRIQQGAALLRDLVAAGL